jgi:hypothetical protein
MIDMAEINFRLWGKVSEGSDGRSATVRGGGDVTSDNAHLLDNSVGSAVIDAEGLGYVAGSRRSEYREKQGE